VNANPVRAAASGPGWLPEAYGQGTIDREPLWFQYSLGRELEVPEWTGTTRPQDLDQPPVRSTRSLLARPGRSQGWRAGLPETTEQDLALRFTAPGTALDGAAATRQLLVDAFAPLRRDPSDPYNDHRGYPSPRCLFPVRPLIARHGSWWAADPDRRELVETGVPADGTVPEGTMALAGFLGAIPRAYQWFRSSLVSLEAGILLRHLAVLGVRRGVRLSVRGPSPQGPDDWLPGVWASPRYWSPPLLLEARADTGPPDTGVLPAPVPRDPPGTDPAAPWADPSTPPAGPATPWVCSGQDPSLEAATALLWSQPPDPLPASVPTGVPEGLLSPPTEPWDHVLLRRSAGRAPRGLYGFRVQDRPLGPAVLDDLVRWATAPAPAPYSMPMTMRVLARGISGRPPVTVRWDRDSAGAWASREEQLPPGGSVEAAYGYPAGPEAANDLHRAPLVVFLSVRPRDLVRALGPTAWTRSAVGTGWVVQGLCLGAAVHGLLARPVRAFDERRLTEALRLDPREMVTLAVVVGHQRPHGGLQINLRK
jgi:hypothetical protein